MKLLGITLLVLVASTQAFALPVVCVGQGAYANVSATPIELAPNTPTELLKLNDGGSLSILLDATNRDGSSYLEIKAITFDTLKGMRLTKLGGAKGSSKDVVVYLNNQSSLSCMPVHQ